MASPLSRQQISDAVSGLGWRYVLGVLRTAVGVGSAQHAAAIAGVVTTEAGDAAGGLRLDLRPGRVVISLQDIATSGVSVREIEAAGRISGALHAAGLRTDPDVGSDESRAVQLIEIGIDAMDIPAIRPFWRAVLGYGDEPGRAGPEDAIVDPQGQGPGPGNEACRDPVQE